MAGNRYSGGTVEAARHKEQLRQTAPEEGGVAREGGFWRLSKLAVPASDDPGKDFLPPARPDAGPPPTSRSQREALVGGEGGSGKPSLLSPTKSVVFKSTHRLPQNAEEGNRPAEVSEVWGLPGRRRTEPSSMGVSGGMAREGGEGP
ncbi:hypothetical protein ZWY2020_039712 [Hordeum vulgare]|nr:hypothetical protein ZWY2020_039712 [Hordeum vulgare]